MPWLETATGSGGWTASTASLGDGPFDPAYFDPLYFDTGGSTYETLTATGEWTPTNPSNGTWI